MAGHLHRRLRHLQSTRSRGGLVNYHWNWGIFFEPNPMGTGTYLDMLLSGLVLTLKTAALAWIIALVFGSFVGVMRTLPSKAAVASPRTRGEGAKNGHSGGEWPDICIDVSGFCDRRVRVGDS